MWLDLVFAVPFRCVVELTIRSNTGRYKKDLYTGFKDISDTELSDIKLR